MLVVAALGVGLWGTRALSDDHSAPRAVAATALSPTSASFSWKGAGGANAYIVHVAADSALTKEAVEVRTTKPQITIGDLPMATPGTDRFFRIDAVYDRATTSSRTGRFALLPGKQSKVSAAKVSADGVQLSWKAVPNARQYDVSIATDEKFTKGVTVVRTLNAVDTFVTAGLTPGTTYWAKVRPVNDDHVGAYGAAAKFRTPKRESSFRIGTWNVCSEKCSGYSSRAKIMAAFLNDNKVDIFGLQESGGQRVGRTTKAIFSGGSQKFVRAAGGAEARYIFYRPAVFTQQSGGYFAIGHGRHATWGRFTVKATGRSFYYVDVHLENGHGNDSKRAAEMNVMLARMSTINSAGLPMIFAGDFNSGRHRSKDSPGTKLRAYNFDDAAELAKDPINARINTGHTFSTSVPASGAHVDHIFVSPDFQVLEWKQLVRMNGGRYAKPVVSDHNALSAVVELAAPGSSVGKLTPIATVGGLTGGAS